MKIHGYEAEMSGAVMLSVRPRWCGLIAEWRKPLEVRKTKPKIPTPFKCYIYCTKDQKVQYWTGPRYSYADDHSHNQFDRCGNGKVIGEFVCDGMDTFSTIVYLGDEQRLSDDDVVRLSCIPRPELREYEKTKTTPGLFAWHISDLMIYDTPKELNEFWRMCPEYDELGPNCWDCENRCGDDEVDCNVDGRLYLTRPPQSWCYVKDQISEVTKAVTRAVAIANQIPPETLYGGKADG